MFVTKKLSSDPGRGVKFWTAVIGLLRGKLVEWKASLRVFLNDSESICNYFYYLSTCNWIEYKRQMEISVQVVLNRE